jgi:hypothetical protein
MDRYSKVLLTIIAASLVLIAARLWEPREAHAQSFLSSAPTIGEWQDAKTPEDRRKLFRRIPMVRVQGGQVAVD